MEVFALPYRLATTIKNISSIPNTFTQLFAGLHQSNKRNLKLILVVIVASIVARILTYYTISQ
jgi:hypothetical protein